MLARMPRTLGSGRGPAGSGGLRHCRGGGRILGSLAHRSLRGASCCCCCTRGSRSGGCMSPRAWACPPPDLHWEGTRDGGRGGRLRSCCRGRSAAVLCRILSSPYLNMLLAVDRPDMHTPVHAIPTFSPSTLRYGIIACNITSAHFKKPFKPLHEFKIVLISLIY